MRVFAAALLSIAAVAAQTPQRLTLEEAEELALKNHPAIAAARFSADAAAEGPVCAFCCQDEILRLWLRMTVCNLNFSRG